MKKFNKTKIAFSHPSSKINIKLFKEHIKCVNQCKFDLVLKQLINNKVKY